MTHKELVDIGAKWLKNHRNNINLRCNYVVTEFMTTAPERPDIFGLAGSSSTVCIEVKVSRSDFLRDAKKRHRKYTKGIGSRRFYLCPESMIKEHEVPPRVGLLYYNNNTQKITGIKNSSYFHLEEREIISEMTIMYSIIRRLAGNPKVFDFSQATTLLKKNTTSA